MKGASMNGVSVKDASMKHVANKALPVGKVQLGEVDTHAQCVRFDRPPMEWVNTNAVVCRGDLSVCTFACVSACVSRGIAKKKGAAQRQCV